MVRITAQLVRLSPAGTLFRMSENLRSLEFDALDRGNVSDLTNFGIMSNSGRITCDDYNGVFKGIYRSNPTLSGHKIEFHLEYPNVAGNTIKQKIGTFNISNTKYDKFNRKIELTLDDGLESWQNKNIDLDFPNYIGTSKTLYEIYTDVNAIIYNKYGISLSLGSGVEALFQSITISEPYRKETVSVWAIVNEICAMSMCRVIADVDGNPCFYATPLSATSSNRNITPSQILSVDLVETPENSAIKGAVVSAQKITIKKVSVIGTQKILLMSTYFDKYSDDDNEKFTVEVDEYGTDITDTKYAGDYPAYKKAATVSTSFPIPMEIVGTITRWEDVSGTANYIIQEYEKTSEVSKDIKFGRALTASQDGLEVTLSFEIDPISRWGYILANDVPMKYDYYNSIDVDFFAMVKMIDGTEEVWSGYRQGEMVELPSSPWLQNENTIRVQSSAQDHALWLVNRIVNTYSDGVECLEMTCNIANNNTPAYFSLYQVVTPYIATPNGQVPYSYNSNGTAKKYLIVGYKFIYNGHPMQKLYLQEI